VHVLPWNLRDRQLSVVWNKIPDMRAE
jgi:hypothetical protein